MRTLHGWAPAKINLGLRVLERRADGFHELRTILQTISLADRLSVGYDPRSDAGVVFECSDPKLAGPDNLAVRAARVLLEQGKWPGSVAIRLEKKVPPGSGLGGGSSDAAAVLLALSRLLNPRPARAQLHEIAAGLGSDIPFFLVGGTAVGVGRGEEIYPLPDSRGGALPAAAASQFWRSDAGSLRIIEPKPCCRFDTRGAAAYHKCFLLRYQCVSPW